MRSDRKPLDNGRCLTQFILETHAPYLIKKVASSHWWPFHFISSPGLLFWTFKNHILVSEALLPIALFHIMTAHTSTSIPFSPLKLYFLNSLHLSASEGPVWCPLPLCNVLSTNCYWSELRVILADAISYKYGSITRVKKKKKTGSLWKTVWEVYLWMVIFLICNDWSLSRSLRQTETTSSISGSSSTEFPYSLLSVPMSSSWEVGASVTNLVLKCNVLRVSDKYWGRALLFSDM